MTIAYIPITEKHLHDLHSSTCKCDPKVTIDDTWIIINHKFINPASRNEHKLITKE